MRFPLLTKIAALAGVLLLLLVALGLVSGVVHEREGRLQEARDSVAASLAGPQQIVGPALLRRCEETWRITAGEGKDKTVHQERRDFELLSTAKTLEVDTQVTMEPRYRGLFKVNGYVAKTSMQAQWASLDALQPRAEHAPSQLRCDEPVLFVAVGDVRGLRNVAVQAQGMQLEVTAGSPREHLKQGFRVAVPAAAWDAAKPFGVELRLEMAGTSLLTFAPVADQTHVHMRSDWAHPSFQGRFLPTERDVGAQGFDAHWRVSALATSAPRDLQQSQRGIESFSVSFIDPVNPYTLSDRATKYGLLFIALTFVGVGLTEVMRRARVHPVQYALVGAALAIFFLLLVSLSEHMPFAWAYAAAAGACTALLAFYGAHVLGSARAGLAFGGGVATLYGVLYLLLQQEQSSLVFGSMLLFAVLAAAMVLTRRIDWYQLAAEWRAEPARHGVAAGAAARS